MSWDGSFSADSPDQIVLGGQETHLWLAELVCQQDRFDQLRSFLCPEERQRASRFRFEEHRRSWVASRGILRELLGSYLGLAPDQVRFAYNEFGKPRLHERQGALHFNLAHSHHRALYGFSDGRELGVDIEQVQSRRVSEGIPERFFAAAEVQYLRSLPEAEQVEAFFNIWTRKEAFVKGVGRGLSLGLDRFEVAVDVPGTPTPVVVLDADVSCELWVTVQLSPGPGYAAAVALKGDPGLIRGWRVQAGS